MYPELNALNLPLEALPLSLSASQLRIHFQVDDRELDSLMFVWSFEDPSASAWKGFAEEVNFR